MKKEVKATFTLTSKEINEALYDFYVRKLKASNIHTVFSENDIEIESKGFLEVSLTIIEDREL